MILPSYPQSGFPVDANWGRQVVDAIRSLRLVAGRGLRKVSDGPDGQVLEATAQTSTQTTSEFDFSKFCFGFRIANNKVTITGGEISVGETYHVLPDWECTIGEDYSYIGIEYNETSAAYIGPSTSIGLFRTGEGKIRCWLHLFRFTEPVAPATVGSVSWHRTGRLFNIDSPGNFA